MTDEAGGTSAHERPVRPDLAEALGRYWEAAYAEGAEGRDHDTEDGRAGLALRDVMLAVEARVAAERERWKAMLLTAAREAYAHGRDGREATIECDDSGWRLEWGA